MRPERLRRGDVVVAVVLTVALIAAGVLLWRSSPADGTIDRLAARPITDPPAAAGIPAGFVEAWRAPSSATVLPAVSGSGRGHRGRRHRLRPGRA